MSKQIKSSSGFKFSVLAAAIMGASGLALSSPSALALMEEPNPCETVGNETTCTGESEQNLTFNESPHAVIVEADAVVTHDDLDSAIFDFDGSSQTEAFGHFSLDNSGSIGAEDENSTVASIRVRGNPDAEGDDEGVISFSLNNGGTITQDQEGHSSLLLDVANIGGDAAIDNSGSLAGRVELDGVGGDVSFANSGGIGGNAAVKNVEGDVDFSNSGTIGNQIQIQDVGGSLTFDNSGDVSQNQTRIFRVAGDVDISNSGSIDRLMMNQSGVQGGDITIANAEGGTIGRFQQFNNLFRTETETVGGDPDVDGDVTTTVDTVTREVVGGAFSLTNAGTVGIVEEDMDGGLDFDHAASNTGGLNVSNAGGDITVTNESTGEMFLSGGISLNSRATLEDTETTAVVVAASGEDPETTTTTVVTFTRDAGADVTLDNSGLLLTGSSPNNLTLDSAANVTLTNSGAIGSGETAGVADISLTAGSIETTETVTTVTVGMDESTVASSERSVSPGNIDFRNSGTLTAHTLTASATGDVTFANTSDASLNLLGRGNEIIIGAQSTGPVSGAAMELRASSELEPGVVRPEAESAGAALDFVNAGSLSAKGSVLLAADDGIDFNNEGDLRIELSGDPGFLLPSTHRGNESSERNFALAIDGRATKVSMNSTETNDDGSTTIDEVIVSEDVGGDIVFSNSGNLDMASTALPTREVSGFRPLASTALGVAGHGDVSFDNAGRIGSADERLDYISVQAGGAIETRNTTTVDGIKAPLFDETVTTAVVGDIDFTNSGELWVGTIALDATGSVSFNNSGSMALAANTLNITAGSVNSTTSSADLDETVEDLDDDGVGTITGTVSSSSSLEETAAAGEVNFVNAADSTITGGDVNIDVVGDVSFANFGSIDNDVNIDNRTILTNSESSSTTVTTETLEEELDEDGDPTGGTQTAQIVVVSSSSSSQTQEVFQGDVNLNNQGTIGGSLNVNQDVLPGLDSFNNSSEQTTTTDFVDGDETFRTTEYASENVTTNEASGGSAGGAITNEANSVVSVDVLINALDDTEYNNLGTVIGDVTIDTTGENSSSVITEESIFVQDVSSDQPPVGSLFLFAAPSPGNPGTPDPDAIIGGGVPALFSSGADYTNGDGPLVKASSQFTFSNSSETVGGSASLNNVSFDSIGGDVSLTGLAEASANNSGLIRGDVGLNAGGGTSSSDTSFSFDREIDITDETVTVVDTASGAFSNSSDVIAGSAALENSGTIGEVSIDVNGDITMAGGQVSVSGTESATVDNSGSGLIYGNVEVSAGGTATTNEGQADWEHVTVLDADSGDVLSRTGTFESTTVDTEQSVASQASVVNAGQIGRQLTQNNGARVSVVGSQAVTATATEASVENSGSILSGVGVTGTGSSSEEVTERSLNFESATDAEGDTTQGVVDVETISSTHGGVGATASLSNSGSIGAEDFAGAVTVSVNGQASATLENEGAITGGQSFSSLTISARDTVTETESVETFTQTQLNGVPVATETEEDELTTVSQGGGTASLDNAGTITMNSVSVTGAPATLLNSGTLTATSGSISVNAQFTDTSNRTTTTTAPGMSSTQRDDSTTVSGGVASVENSGTIHGSLNVTGFEAATVTNAANWAINGNVTATSRGTDTTFESDTTFAAGEQTGSFTSTTTAVGGLASVSNAGTIDGSVTANGFTGSEVDNAVTGLITGSVTLGGPMSSYVDTVNVDGVVTSTPAGPDLGEDGSETVLNNAGVIGGGVNARAFGLNEIDNSGAIGGTVTVAAFEPAGNPSGGASEIVNSGVVGGITSTHGNTTVLNTGIILGSVNFNAAGSMNTLTMASGSHIASGAVNALSDPASGANLTATTIELQGLGLFSGNVSGVDQLTKDGEGTWVLTGSGTSGASPTTATYDIAAIDIVGGGIQFGGGFVAGPTPGTPFQQPGFLAGNTALDPRFSDAVNDALAGAGQFGTNTVINVDGNINVGEAGALSGEFALFGDLEVAGSFTPGFVSTRSNPRTAGPGQLPFIAPGQVAIDGDYTIAGGTHAIGFGPTLRSLGGGQFGEESMGTNLTTVSGDVVADGTLSVLVETGLYVDGQSAEFLRVSGALDAGGLTLSPTVDPRFVNFGVATAEADGETVVSITASRSSFTTAAGDGNQAAAAGALDIAVDDVVTTLRTADIDSDAYRSAQALGRIITQLDFGGLSDAQVQATFGDFAPGFFASLNALDVSRPVLASTLARSSGRMVPTEQERGIYGWAEGHLLNDRMDAANGAAGIKSDFRGLSAGIEARDERSLLGLAFGYSDISVDGRGNSNRADVDARTLALYAGHRNGPFTVSGQVGYTWSEFETRRALGGMLPAVLSGTAASSVGSAVYDSEEWNLSAQVAYDFELDNGLLLTPLAELRYRDRSTDSYREEVGGVALLDVNSSSGSMWIPTVGLELSAEKAFGEWMVRPVGGLRYAFVPSSDEEIDVRLIGTNSTFEVGGAEMDNQLTISAGVELDRGRLSIFGGALTGFTGDQRSLQINAGLRYRF